MTHGETPTMYMRNKQHNICRCFRVFVYKRFLFRCLLFVCFVCFLFLLFFSLMHCSKWVKAMRTDWQEKCEKGGGCTRALKSIWHYGVRSELQTHVHFRTRSCSLSFGKHRVSCIIWLLSFFFGEEHLNAKAISWRFIRTEEVCFTFPTHVEFYQWVYVVAVFFAVVKQKWIFQAKITAFGKLYSWNWILSSWLILLHWEETALESRKKFSLLQLSYTIMAFCMNNYIFF